MSVPDFPAISQAITDAVLGNTDQALDRLRPMVAAGPDSAYALMCVLADVFLYEPGHPRGRRYALTVTSTDGPEDPEVLPPPHRFALRFTTARGNWDLDTANALFWAIARPPHGDGALLLDQALQVLLEMATAAAMTAVGEALARRRDQPPAPPVGETS
ncbi:hypothetical protein ACFT54_09770 [Streptomyces cinereoruber]|uniref:hypothetical protein n=1 Tax=Streptomyces cinereoruber TaxID=67260 RepID=UPI003641833B